MKKGNRAELTMKKPLHVGNKKDEHVYPCTILKYENAEESIWLLLDSDRLSDLSLDAVYECVIQTDDGHLVCEGIIKERYLGEDGKTFRFQIKDGFYKINIKYVDKQNT